MTANKNSTRYCSHKQEETIAKLVGGKLSSNSGASKYNCGDVLTKDFLIEAKTTMKPKDSFSIKKEWLIKNNLERQFKNKPYGALAFQFEPDGENYFIIDSNLFKKLVSYMEES